MCILMLFKHIFVIQKQTNKTKQNYEVTNMYLITFPNTTERN